jgi:hypothetical protein
MRKERTNDSAGCLRVKVHFEVTRETFILALRNHFYRTGDHFPDKLMRPDALKILKDQLKAYGESEPLELDAMREFEDETVRIAKLYERAEKWVAANYPFLSGYK